MGQSSISMLNKVGYSMFWGSMWDNSIAYNRLLKEDIYLNKFFDLIFNDNLSINVFNIKNKKSGEIFRKNFFSISNKNDFSLYKYLKASSKIDAYNSKIWVLRYQNWVIIYYFVFLKKFNINSKQFENVKQKNRYKINLSYIINIYSKINKNLKLSYKIYNKNPKKVFF